MMDDRAGDQVVARIGFAERWLERAKGQVARGNLPRGVLTLVLADAEVHHAMEVVGATSPARPRHTLVASAALTLAALALASAVAVTRFAPGHVDSSTQEPPIVTLPARLGVWLDLVTPPAAVPALASVRRPAGAAPTLVRGAVRPVPSPVSSTTRPRATSVPVTVAAPPAVPPSVPTFVAVAPVPATSVASGAELSAGELIDAVLAADRALRSEPARP